MGPNIRYVVIRQSHECYVGWAHLTDEERLEVRLRLNSAAARRAFGARLRRARIAEDLPLRAALLRSKVLVGPPPAAGRRVPGRHQSQGLKVMQQ